MPVTDVERLSRNRVDAIRAYHERTGIARAQLDISGGVDSATMLGLLVLALGPAQITAVYSSIHSSNESRARARAVADAFGVALLDLDLRPAFEAAVAELHRGFAAAGYDMSAIDANERGDATVLGGFRSCFRAPIGRAANRMSGGGIRHGTGNECEDRFVRFYQKGGDGEVDTNPIAMLSKGEVFQLARHLGVPRSVLVAVPSPDLQARGEAHTDEDELRELTGVAWTYSRVDPDGGGYTSVGSIERMSRFLDTQHGKRLLADEDPDDDTWRAISDAARPFFADCGDDERMAFVRSARHLDRATRHKWNPNCPTLGERESLVAAGILSDELPL